jgi:hypothetical protein
MRLPALAVLAVLVSGVQAVRAAPPAHQGGGQAGPGGKSGAAEMKVQSSVGSLDQAAVEGSIGARANADTIQNCYRMGVAKFRFLDGKLGVKVKVKVDGAVKQVDTTMPLGSFEVERCVADVIRGLRFGPPRGDAEAEFDYVWEFRSSAPVQYWEETDVGKVFLEHRAELKACGKGKGELPVTFYVMPGGKVGSVSVGGIGLEERRARCLADRIAKWRFPDPLGTVAHAAYVIPENQGGR